jgi:SAM-dependent methyltransferase
VARDYLKVEYDVGRRPLTTYPELLAGYMARMAGMRPGDALLEVGSGRAEVAKGFVGLGIHVTAVDSSPSAGDHARHAGAEFIQATVNSGTALPIPPASQDFVFSKSFVEHLREPIPFLEMCRDLLKPGGTIICLTPDWEANYRVFFDDITHVTPFSRATMRQALDLAGFEHVDSFRFRQLPMTWRHPLMNLPSAAIAPFVPVRATKKFLRWSRELMLCGMGRRPAHDSGVGYE